MVDTPAQQLKAIGAKVADSVNPQTKVAIPAIMLCAAAWWVLDTIRTRDLDRIATENASLRTSIATAHALAHEAQTRSADLLLRVTKSETAQEYTSAALGEMRTDIKGILVEIRQMRQEARP